MTPEQEQECLKHAERVAAAENSPWQPRLVSEAFLATTVRVGWWDLGPLTMRGWLALDARRSPFLSGDPLPPEMVLERLAEAIGILSGQTVTVDDVTREIASGGGPAAIQAVTGICNARFSTSVSMVSPIRGGTPMKEDGFGSWLPIFTALVKELGLSIESALDIAVNQAIALLSTARHNEGYTVAGENYRVREIEG